MERAAESSIRAAQSCLESHDLEGCKRFAELAIESDPLADNGADRLVAVSEVLLAADGRRINNHLDWYYVLGIESSTAAARRLPAVRNAYRRLALLLRSDDEVPSSSSSTSAFSRAFRLVSEAWSILSDPTKKSLFDSELEIYIARSEEETFWTVCSSCYNAHLYDRVYCGRILRCPSCHQAFTAVELAAPPPIVPGTESYYCSWGIRPVGFNGQGEGPVNWTYGSPQPTQRAQPPFVGAISSGEGGYHHGRFKKAVAAKKRKSGRGSNSDGAAVAAEVVEIDINEEEAVEFAMEGGSEEGKFIGVDINEVVEEVDDEMPNFAIDIEAAKQLLSDLTGLSP